MARKCARMRMFCSNCDNKCPLKGNRITCKYKESGLANVTLVGVEHFKCTKCREEYFAYGNIDKLHGTIAHALLQKKDLLNGSEIRFLRKYLGYSVVQFAKIIGRGCATLSRLENDARPFTRRFDRLVRFTVAAKLRDRNYDLHDLLLKGEGIETDRIELSSTAKGGWELKAA